jgi:hypothetical protein
VQANRGARSFLGAIDAGVKYRNRLQLRAFGHDCPSERPGASHADDSRARERHATLSHEKITKINILGWAQVDKRSLLCSKTYILSTKAHGFRVKRGQIWSGLI